MWSTIPEITRRQCGIVGFPYLEDLWECLRTGRQMDRVENAGVAIDRGISTASKSQRAGQIESLGVATGMPAHLESGYGILETVVERHLRRLFGSVPGPHLLGTGPDPGPHGLQPAQPGTPRQAASPVEDLGNRGSHHPAVPRWADEPDLETA
ncbi:hypothetical protein BDP81DRAFT_427605 [Colletotrichum phormii]|uniref:Uncharacterized protein n=1 Tax=Colletotrichum phormii TaxID=359342 RepID=A0AAJ0EGY1_9PEZI|nr:uncharacterized protein BDP81DRAFT_427605 [Colletotrichum phormii]KAK1636430.1 hypothetical protein BDP81DRAFT_427605 [Colletotrichum phormii]